MTDDELDQRVRESVLAEEVDASRVAAAVREQIAAHRRSVPGWAVAAAGIFAMIAASTWSYRIFRTEQATPAICAAAVQDHQREIVQGEPRQWLTDISAIQALAQKQGVPPSAIAALGTKGYRLERGRLCFLQKQIFLHLVYSKDAREYSVYLHSPTGLFTSSVHRAGQVAYFETSRVTAVFVSDVPGRDAQAFARAGAKVL